MSDPTSSYTTNEGGQQQQPQFFTEDQVNAIIDQVTKRVRETQLAELEQRIQGSSLPEDIQEELDGYNPAQLQKALQRYKKAVPKYNNEEWNTPEEINPNFIKRLKQWKVDSHHLVTTIYRLTETTRLQARAATEIYEQLQFVAERGWQLEDGEIVNEAVEKVRRLAVFGYGIAKAQEDEAREETTKALRLPHSIKHLESPAKGDKKYAFSTEFVQKYYDAYFQQELTTEAARKSDYKANNFNRRGRGSSNGYRGRSFFSHRGRGRGKSGGQEFHHESPPQNSNHSPNGNNQ